jgi:hypothetical protein
VLLLPTREEAAIGRGADAWKACEEERVAMERRARKDFMFVGGEL